MNTEKYQASRLFTCCANLTKAAPLNVISLKKSNINIFAFLKYLSGEVGVRDRIYYMFENSLDKGDYCISWETLSPSCIEVGCNAWNMKIRIGFYEIAIEFSKYETSEMPYTCDAVTVSHSGEVLSLNNFGLFLSGFIDLISEEFWSRVLGGSEAAPLRLLLKYPHH